MDISAADDFTAIPEAAAGDIKKAELEEEHIKGIFRDHLYEKKNICAAL